MRAGTATLASGPNFASASTAAIRTNSSSLRKAWIRAGTFSPVSEVSVTQLSVVGVSIAFALQFHVPKLQLIEFPKASRNSISISIIPFASVGDVNCPFIVVFLPRVKSMFSSPMRTGCLNSILVVEASDSITEVIPFETLEHFISIRVILAEAIAAPSSEIVKSSSPPLAVPLLPGWLISIGPVKVPPG